ncbi:hypothetical protein QQ045_032841 [Rhodiola kirilowii]
MDCEAIHSWSFSRLVGAYLDLAITFLLLCGATLAYAASRFLAFFGMSLPCPCNGMFGDPNKDLCLQKFLLEHPTQNISAVQMSVKSKFPFDMVWWSKDQHDQKGFMVRRDGYYEDKHDYLEGEGVYASAKSSVESFGNGVAEEGRCKKKGTATVVHNAKEWSRRRRKSPLSCLKTSSISTDDCVTSTAQTEDVHAINTKQEIASKGMVPVDFPMLGDFKGAQNESSTEESSSKWFSSDEFVKESKANIDDIPALQEHDNKVEGRIEVKHGDENAIRLLKQALEEEQTAHAALYLELEKERSAAASAADEAMAMILRLREEKAIVEMNARQYKRMVEEKSVFDAEEMNLLKEILLRRERETHYLEKEVEAYRRMMVGNVQLDCQSHRVALEHAGLETQSDTSVSQMELPGLKWNDYVEIAEQGDNFEYYNYINDAYLRIGEEGASSMHEKVIVLQDTVHSQHIEMKSSVEPSLFEIPGSSQRTSFLERTITPSREKLEHKDEISTFEGVMKTDPKDNIGENFAQCGNAAYSRIEGSSIPADKAESHVYDVHVVDCHQSMSVNFQNDETECGPENISITSLSERNKLRDAGVPTTTNTLLVEAEQNIVRSQTDISLSSPPLNTSIGKVHSARRRNSMSSVDCERLRIESEVGLLREKMRIVQEGRRKLKLSVDLKEREKVQLQVLDDTANQLQEIRHKTSPEKVARQSSLPPQPSKVSRKRNKVPLP